MAKEKGSMSGAATPYQDKDGVTIRIHNYVKDAAGKRYYINSRCMAVPEEDGSPSIALAALIEKTPVTVMTAEEVLAAPAPQSSDQSKQKQKASKTGASDQDKEQKEAAQKPEKDALTPVTMQMLLTAIPDDELANELRRRGYTLCAVRPALITL